MTRRVQAAEAPKVPVGPAAASGRRAPSSPFRGLLPLREEIPASTYRRAAVGALASLLVAWSVLTYGGLVDPLFLPRPDRVVLSTIESARSGVLWSDIASSVYRVTVGWLLSTLLAVPLGVLMGNFRLVEALLEGPVALTRYMPVVAFIPLSILWVGVGDSQKFLMIFLGTFVQEVLMIADNVKSVPKDLIHVAYTFGLSKWEVLRHVVIPHSLPGMVDTFRITIGWAWTYLVVAELVAATTGLGYRIMQAQRYLATEVIIQGILVIGLIGLVTDLAFKAFYRWRFAWVRQRSTAAE